MRTESDVHTIAAYTAFMFRAVPSIDGRTAISTARYLASVAAVMYDAQKSRAPLLSLDDMGGLARYIANCSVTRRREATADPDKVIVEMFKEYVLGKQLADKLLARRAEPTTYIIAEDAYLPPAMYGTISTKY